MAALERMAREIEDLRAWMAAHEELDYHRQWASVIRHALPNRERRDPLSISGVVELSGEPCPDDPGVVNPTYVPPRCSICGGEIVEGSKGFKVRTSFHIFGGERREELVQYHVSCVNRRVFDSSAERFFES